MRGLWAQLLAGFIGKEFIVHFKGQHRSISGTLNQVINEVIHYSPIDSNFSDGFIFIPEILFIEFKCGKPITSPIPPKTDTQLKNSSINDYIVE